MKENIVNINRLPFSPDELARRDNIPATESVPREIATRLTTPSRILSPLEAHADIGRHLAVDPGGVPGWHFQHVTAGLPGRSAIRLDIDTLAQFSADGSLTPAYRPPWVGYAYHPKLSVARRFPSMRSVKGKRVEPFYGIFGNDDRQVFYPSGYPWHCIGRVFVWTDTSQPNWAWSGSGVLVGPRVILTAAHVVPWSSPNWGMQFIPGYYDGGSVDGPGGASWVSDARSVPGADPSTVSARDVAVLRLYDPLGNSLGHLGSKTYDDAWEDAGVWTLVGYPGDVAGGQRPSYQSGIPVLDDDSDGDSLELEHQGDATPGDSGGPLFGTWDDGPYVIGTTSGGELISGGFLGIGDEDNNIAAGGKAMPDLINWALANWPA